MNRFVKGIVLLSLAAFFAECLEFVINMILARELGEHGMGLYMSVLPSIFLVVVIASLELPVSISKFIAESNPEAARKHAETCIADDCGLHGFLHGSRSDHSSIYSGF